MHNIFSYLLLLTSFSLLGGSYLLLASGFDDEQSEPSSPAFSHLFSSDCTYRQEGTTYRLPAHCVLQGKLPTLPLPTIVDLLRDEIGDFREQYQPFAPTYRYYGGQPIFSSAFSSLLDGSFEASQQLIRFTQQGKEIGLTTYELARYWVQNLAFYVSEKDISQLSPCNTQNYMLALQRLDGYLLAPGATFNANRELAKVKGYCTGRGEPKFLFYGGVCGMTAQTFRTAIMHPAIEIVKRRPHNEWFVQYYGEDVGGDDAAIYEMSKQFEMKNNGSDDIYFKVKRNAEHTFLVAVSPRTTQWVEITKHPLTQRSIDLERTIYERSSSEEMFPMVNVPILGREPADHLLNQEIFSSVYAKKNYELR